MRNGKGFVKKVFVPTFGKAAVSKKFERSVKRSIATDTLVRAVGVDGRAPLGAAAQRGSRKFGEKRLASFRGAPQRAAHGGAPPK